jgi:hypothetical protein
MASVHASSARDGTVFASYAVALAWWCSLVSSISRALLQLVCRSTSASPVMRRAFRLLHGIRFFCVPAPLRIACPINAAISSTYLFGDAPDLVMIFQLYASAALRCSWILPGIGTLCCVLPRAAWRRLHVPAPSARSAC